MRRFVFTLTLIGLLPGFASAQELYLSGVDLSFVEHIEANGGSYFDVQQTVSGAVEVFAVAGVNAVRLRLWVNPVEPYNDLDAVLRMARRAADNDLALLLDIHYSDTWPPGRPAPAESIESALTHRRRPASMRMHTPASASGSAVDVKWLVVPTIRR